LYQFDNQPKPITDTDHPNKKPRNRVLPYLWYKTFFCHRKGEKEQSKAAPNGKSGVVRPVQKLQKKLAVKLL
jgi:hypothetical protein